MFNRNRIVSTSIPACLRRFYFCYRNATSRLNTASFAPAAQTLQQSTRPTLWLDWFRGSDTDPRRILRGARLDHFDMIVDAAIAGLGIGIVPEIVARPALDRGALALAAPRRFETGESYALILPEPARQSPHVQRFRNWLLREIAA